jgi:hypothetical protein
MKGVEDDSLPAYRTNGGPGHLSISCGHINTRNQTRHTPVASAPLAGPVSIRHPIASAESWLRRGWCGPPGNTEADCEWAGNWSNYDDAPLT